jgi:hypothetical protein
MSHKIMVNPNDQSITINNLIVSNADFFAVIAVEPPESQEQAVLDIIAVGSAAMQRVRTTIDVDFVEKRFSTLTGVFDKALSALESRATDALSKRFSPTESGSYTKQIGDLIAETKRQVQVWNKELETNTHALLDPDKKTSGIAKLGELIQQAGLRFQQMFDPDLRTSYAYRLNEKLSQVFGTDGHAGALQSALQDALKPVFTELHEVKEKIEAKKAAEQVVEFSPLKGKPFEDWVHAELARLAQPYSDDVQLVASGSNGSRAGDFIVAFSSIGKNVVVEARNRKQMSLPAIKAELDREMKERAAEFAIYVSSGAEMLPQHVGTFQIYDNKVVTSAENLHIAYRLARLLASLEAPEGTLDTVTLRSVLAKIKDAARSLRDIKGKATQVKKFAEGINSDANRTETMILSLIEEAEKMLEPPSKPPMSTTVVVSA